jgi:hypothetical protein
MANEQKPKHSQRAMRYRQVDVADLDRGRRGKHHELVQGILEELRAAPPGAALEIPLSEVGDRTGESAFRRSSRVRGQWNYD